MTKLNFYVKYLIQVIPKFFNFIFYKNNKINEIYVICFKEYIYNFLFFIKMNNYFQFKSLNDICVVDYPFKKNRFEVIYNLVSVRNSFRLFLKTHVTANNYVSSIVSLYNSAN